MNQNPKQKQPRQTKNKAMLVRLTSKEKEIIVENAKKLNMNVSNYLITAGTKNKLLPKKNREALQNKDLIFALSKIGANINQIARYANINKVLDRIVIAELALINQKLREIRDKNVS